MQNPTLPAWATMIAAAGLTVLVPLSQSTTLPWWEVALAAAGVGALTYISHLTTSRKDAATIAKLGGGLKP